MVAVRPTFGKGGYYTTLRKQDSVLSWERSTFEGGLGVWMSGWGESTIILLVGPVVCKSNRPQRHDLQVNCPEE